MSSPPSLFAAALPFAPLDGAGAEGGASMSAML